MTTELDIRKAGNASGEKRRKAMIDAAYSLFVERGYEAVTLDDIIKVSGGSKSSLYKYFSNKEGILKAVIESLAAAIEQQIDVSVKPKQSTRDALKRVGSMISSLALSLNAVNQYRLAVLNAKIIPGLSQLWYNCGPKTTFDGFAAYLETEKAAGRLKIDNPRRAALFFLGMIIFKDNLAMSIGADPPSKKEMEDVVTEAVEVFLAAYGT